MRSKQPMAAAVSKGIEEIYGQARRQATRIRMKALEDAVQMADRVTELSGLQGRARARASRSSPRWRRERLGLEAEDRPAVGTEPAGAGMYSGEVEIEVGPLDDFAQLTGFEDAAGGHRRRLRDQGEAVLGRPGAGSR